MKEHFCLEKKSTLESIPENTLGLDLLTSRYRQEQEQLGQHNEHTLFKLSAMLFYTHHTHSYSHVQHCWPITAVLTTYEPINSAIQT